MVMMTIYEEGRSNQIIIVWVTKWLFRVLELLHPKILVRLIFKVSHVERSLVHLCLCVACLRGVVPNKFRLIH